MDVDTYLAGAPEPHATTLRALRERLRSILPDAEETISYAIPALKVDGKALAGYAYFKNHCSYFPHSGSVLPVLADSLGSYDWDKGTLRFPVNAPLDTALLRALVEERARQVGVTL